MEKKAKTVHFDVRALILHDITALSNAHSAIQSARLRTLFFMKWDTHEAVAVRTLIEHFRREWCSERLGNWTHGHISNYVNNTNGLESTNKVIKDDVTKRQLMPMLNFLLKIQNWLGEQSEKGDIENPNYIHFAPSHTFTTADWTAAYAWKVDNKKQIRFVTELQTYVALSAISAGHLTAERAVTLINTFDTSSWNTFDEFTNMFFNVSILRVDNSRPEGFKCTCVDNCKLFTCRHSLGVAIIRGTMVPPANAVVHLLGRKRRRGRKPQAAPAWERMGFDVNSPIHHPQQNLAELAGIAGVGENLEAELQAEV